MEHTRTQEIKDLHHYWALRMCILLVLEPRKLLSVLQLGPDFRRPGWLILCRLRKRNISNECGRGLTETVLAFYCCLTNYHRGNTLK